MQLSLNKQSALRALRAIRCGKIPQVNRPIARMARAPLRSSQRPDGRKRWSPAAAHLTWLGMPQPTQRVPLHVAVPSDPSRVRARFFSCTIYSAGLPDDAFLDIGNGIQVASPELLFVELATVMIPQVLVLLGYELTGRYSRDADSPRLGPITYGIPPLTTVEKIKKLHRAMPRHSGALLCKGMHKVCIRQFMVTHRIAHCRHSRAPDRAPGVRNWHAHPQRAVDRA